VDDRRFDTVVKGLAMAQGRRGFFKSVAAILGITAASAIVTRDADAARRGYSGPQDTVPEGVVSVSWAFHAGGPGLCDAVVSLSNFPPGVFVPITVMARKHGKTGPGSVLWTSSTTTDGSGAATVYPPAGALPIFSGGFDGRAIAGGSASDWSVGHC
jgi:hypothetical protein